MVTVDQHLYQPTLKEKEKRSALLITMLLNLTFATGQLIVSFFSGSLAMISDSVQGFGDSFAIGVAYLAQRFLLKPPTGEKSFGNLRITILVAFFNALSLYLITFLIFAKAIEKIFNPTLVSAPPLLIFGVLGVLVNGFSSLLLLKNSKEIDIKGVFFHSLLDSLGSLGVLIAGIVLSFSNFYLIDPLISLAIGLLVLYGAFKVSVEAIGIFLEGTPRGIDAALIKTAIMEKFKEVDAVHDLHLWVLGPNKFALSAHLAVNDMTISDSRLLLNRVKNLMRNKFNVWHTAFELECPSCLTPWDIPEEKK